MSFFGKLLAVIRGMFIKAGDDLVSGSPESIRATYASAIDDAKKRYKEMEVAVALLARERERTETTLKSLDKEGQELQRKLEGALAMAEAEPGNESHREAGSRYIERINEIDQKQALLTADLEAQRQKVDEYKVKLRSLNDEVQKLQREQGEMIAEFVSHQQVIRLEDRLRGLGETSVDESVVAIRDKVAQLRAQAKIATELRTSTLDAQDVTYQRIGAEREASTRFDELLKARTDAKQATAQKERDLG